MHLTKRTTRNGSMTSPESATKIKAGVAMSTIYKILGTNWFKRRKSPCKRSPLRTQRTNALKWRWEIKELKIRLPLKTCRKLSLVAILLITNSTQKICKPNFRVQTPPNSCPQISILSPKIQTRTLKTLPLMIWKCAISRWNLNFSTTKSISF